MCMIVTHTVNISRYQLVWGLLRNMKGKRPFLSKLYLALPELSKFRVENTRTPSKDTFCWREQGLKSRWQINLRCLKRAIQNQ